MVILLLVSTLLFAQRSSDIQRMFETYHNHSEVYLRIENSASNIKDVSSLLSICSRTNDRWIYGYANREQLQQLAIKKFEFELMPHPSIDIAVEMRDKINIKEIEDWDFYPTYTAYVDMMQQFESDYPNLCEVFSIGQTNNGHDIWFARISDNADQDPGEAQFLYTATMHGNELTGYVLALRLIHHILSEYGSDPQITNLINNLDIWINPLANPDGTYISGDDQIVNPTRLNANGVDLNRNFPDPTVGDHPDGNPWQIETIAFIELAEQNRFVMSSNWHTGAEVFNYPWDTWELLPADNDWWDYVGRSWADVRYYINLQY